MDNGVSREITFFLRDNGYGDTKKAAEQFRELGLKSYQVNIDYLANQGFGIERVRQSDGEYVFISMEGEEFSQIGILAPTHNNIIEISWVVDSDMGEDLLLVPNINTFGSDLESDPETNRRIASAILNSLGLAGKLQISSPELTIAIDIPTLGPDGVQFVTQVCTKEQLIELMGYMKDFITPPYMQ